MKKISLILPILIIGILFVVGGCATINKGAVGQPLNKGSTKVLTDTEINDLQANYNFEAVGAVQTQDDGNGGKISTQKIRLTPKKGTVVPYGITINCHHSGCRGDCEPAGCVPVYVSASCSSAWCTDNCNNQHPTCSKSVEENY